MRLLSGIVVRVNGAKLVVVVLVIFCIIMYRSTQRAGCVSEKALTSAFGSLSVMSCHIC